MKTTSFAALILLAGVAPAFADDKVAAESAFRAAKELEHSGKHAEACPLYETSYRADPALGALLNLANCHEVIGRTGTAWAELREAIELATRRNDARAEFARRRLAALEPRLVRLRIELSAGAPAGVTVERNGNDITPLLGQDLVVDPGSYRVRATAPGRLPWETSVGVQREGETVRVAVPELVHVAVEPAPAIKLGVAPTRIKPRPQPVSPPSSRRTVAVVVGVTGVATAIVGLGFGYHARSQWTASRASTSCDDHNVCNPTGSAQIDSARSSARIATWGISAGAALLVTAGVVWLTAPSKRETPRVTVAPSIDRHEIGVAALARF